LSIGNRRFKMEDAKLLTTAEVASELRCSERTVLNAAAAGKIPSLRPFGGKRRLYRSEDVAKFRIAT
jgi:excisionase family DNA binding protein